MFICCSKIPKVIVSRTRYKLLPRIVYNLRHRAHYVKALIWLKGISKFIQVCRLQGMEEKICLSARHRTCKLHTIIALHLLYIRVIKSSFPPLKIPTIRRHVIIPQRVISNNYAWSGISMRSSHVSLSSNNHWK